MKIKKSIKLKNLLMFFICLLPLLIVFNNDEYWGITKYYIPIMLVILCSLIICIYNKKIYLAYNVFDSVIFFIFIMISTIVANVNLNRGYWLSYLLFIVLYLSIIVHKYTGNEIQRFISAFILSGFIISGLIIVLRIPFFENSNSRYTLQIFNQSKVDPNFLGAYLCTPFLLSVRQLMENRNRRIRSKLYYLISAMTIFIGILMTASRGALVSIILGVFFVFLDYVKLRRYMKAKTALLLLFILFIILLTGLHILINKIPVESLNRLFKESYVNNAGTDKRISIWLDALETISRYPLFGIGIRVVDGVMSTYKTAHNTYLELWLHMGIGGLLTMLGLILKPMLKSIWKEQFFIVGIGINTLMSSLFIAAETAFSLWINIICLSLLLISNEKNGVEYQC